MRAAVLAVVVAFAVTMVSVAYAATAKGSYSYRATMTPKQEVPKPTAPAKAGGVFTATVTENGTKRSIRWTLTFHNLSGKAVAAHIHLGKPGVAGGVLFPLCGPCKNGATGRLAISTDAADALEQGNAYANIHTAKNAGGEIRGPAKLVGHT